MKKFVSLTKAPGGRNQAPSITQNFVYVWNLNSSKPERKIKCRQNENGERGGVKSWMVMKESSVFQSCVFLGFEGSFAVDVLDVKEGKCVFQFEVSPEPNKKKLKDSHGVSCLYEVKMDTFLSFSYLTCLSKYWTQSTMGEVKVWRISLKYQDYHCTCLREVVELGNTIVTDVCRLSQNEVLFSCDSWGSGILNVENLSRRKFETQEVHGDKFQVVSRQRMLSYDETGNNSTRYWLFNPTEEPFKALSKKTINLNVDRYGVACTKDGLLAVGNCFKNKLHVYDMQQNFKMLSKITTAKSGITCVHHVVSTKFIVGHRNGMLKLVDVSRKQKKSSQRIYRTKEKSKVVCVEFLPRGFRVHRFLHSLFKGSSFFDLQIETQ